MTSSSSTDAGGIFRSFEEEGRERARDNRRGEALFEIVDEDKPNEEDEDRRTEAPREAEDIVVVGNIFGHGLLRCADGRGECLWTWIVEFFFQKNSANTSFSFL